MPQHMHGVLRGGGNSDAMASHIERVMQNTICVSVSINNGPSKLGKQFLRVFINVYCPYNEVVTVAAGRKVCWKESDGRR